MQNGGGNWRAEVRSQRSEVRDRRSERAKSRREKRRRVAAVHGGWQPSPPAPLPPGEGGVGLALMVLPTLIVGNELLILGGVGVAAAGSSLTVTVASEASWMRTGMGWMIGGGGSEVRGASSPSPRNAVDTRSCRHKVTENEPDAKAILPEPRSVQKANSYQWHVPLVHASRPSQFPPPAAAGTSGVHID